eukprot:GHVS01049654.1.p1 GENE.GHVS01049654.1~~GHVS01049654.1.p1  ORF type:complete len:145 (-),score=21.27 GHVS01049654.1:180-614(-)
MAKGIRCKSQRRLRSVKRQKVLETIEADRIQNAHEKLVKIQQGLEVSETTPPNAFLHPDDLQAVFPQHNVKPALDFRPESLPLAGFACVGNRRKYTTAEKLHFKKKYGHTPTGGVLDDIRPVSVAVTETVGQDGEEVMMFEGGA